MSDVMAGINNLSMENERRWSRIEDAILTFQTELMSLKEVMVTKQMFSQLEERVVKLEQYGGKGETEGMKILRQQVAKLDPANRSLRFRGFKEESLENRQKIIDDITELNFRGPTYGC